MIRNIFKKETIITGCDHVQHYWLSDLSWKMQTVINQGLRAPDTHFCKNIKILCRWMRGIVLQNADKDHTFMCNKIKMPTIEELEHELNYCSVHFATHFLYCMEIIAYYHPEDSIRKTAYRYYEGIVGELWHLRIETESKLDIRLADVDREPTIKECPKDSKQDKYINYG
jgi:hypothetical protein